MGCETKEREISVLLECREAYELVQHFLKTLTRARLRSLPATWGSLESDDLKEFIDWVVKNPSVQFAPCVKAWLRTLAGLESPSVTVAPQLDRSIDAGMQLLATWQGPWGVIKKEDAAFFRMSFQPSKC